MASDNWRLVVAVRGMEFKLLEFPL